MAVLGSVYIVDDPGDVRSGLPQEALSEDQLLDVLSDQGALSYDALLSGQVIRLTRHHTRCAFQVMGCKVRHSHSICEWVFGVLEKIQRSSPRPSQNSEAPSITLSRTQLLMLARAGLNQFGYMKADHLHDFSIALDIIGRKRSVTILLGGTSGTGKSTLASLIASRFGVATVLSTDSIRHILRNFLSKDENPVLFASTYEAGEKLPPQPERLSDKERTRLGYETQCSLIYEKLDELISIFESRNESLVIEGVHLNVDVMRALLQRHPSCIPFVVFISNESKHRERFAVRSKYMTLDPRHNKYVQYFNNIRVIQKALTKKADTALIPKVDNTSVDRSVGIIHATLTRCLRKLASGESVYDPKRKQALMLHQEYTATQKHVLSSKAMQQIIKMRVSKKELFQRFFKAESESQPSEKVVLRQFSFGDVGDGERQANTFAARVSRADNGRNGLPMHDSDDLGQDGSTLPTTAMDDLQSGSSPLIHSGSRLIMMNSAASLIGSSLDVRDDLSASQIPEIEDHHTDVDDNDNESDKDDGDAVGSVADSTIDNRDDTDDDNVQDEDVESTRDESGQDDEPIHEPLSPS